MPGLKRRCVAGHWRRTSVIPAGNLIRRLSPRPGRPSKRQASFRLPNSATIRRLAFRVISPSATVALAVSAAQPFLDIGTAVLRFVAGKRKGRRLAGMPHMVNRSRAGRRERYRWDFLCSCVRSLCHTRQQGRIDPMWWTELRFGGSGQHQPPDRVGACADPGRQQCVR